MKEKIILAYSGGLDTSTMVKWLQKEKGYDVVTLSGDLGQNLDMQAINEKAKKVGASKTYCLNLKQEFVDEYVFPALKANALYEGSYPLGTALGRPLLAKKMLEIAKKENAAAVAHGCTGKGNDQVRFEVSINALDPDLKIIAPIREWGLTRNEEIEYCKNNGIDLPSEAFSKYSTDQNLWGRSIECGSLEDPSKEPEPDVFEWTTSPEQAPEKPEYLTIGFNKGIPVSLNGNSMNGVELIQKLNEIGGKHGIGVVDHMESRLVGIKSHEIYENPAATILIEAHKDLEKLVLTKHVLSFKKKIEQEWSELVYNGLWMDPLKGALDKFIDSTQKTVTGNVNVKLYKGNCIVVGRESPNSIYEYDLATYSETGTFDHKASEHFIKLWGLQSVLFNLKNNGKK